MNEKKYTNTKVIVERYDELEYEQYLQRINTELMAGKGPDLIYSYFPFDEYQEKGMLLKLDDMINNDPEFDMTDYDQTIINVYRSKDGFYVMPVSYIVDSFLVNSTLV
ncbi:extracellular solute-binding protein [Lutispora thermophila]|uniref:Extracellular solute-binding protein n=1 Tax=Lutispora thermophila DSM 19022 TaxID=1122184 RepID=A0A1M6DMY5_9FIRM|nr:extracellular solute-binding protein [Lutispora thermophila]SHI74338.1 extracellular solute-binding protein [Lutispora thermophila DSM 19022]